MNLASLLMPMRHLHALLVALVFAATASAASGESWSPAERSTIAFYMRMPTGVSVREQYLYQEILSKLLWVNASQISEMEPCTWKVLPESEFGVFSVSVDHPNPARRLGCLHAGVHHLLRQTISELDFLTARKREAEFVARSRKPNLTITLFDRFEMPRSALRSIYQQGSTLHQLYSIGSNDFLAVSFEEFERWLHRSREDGLIIFGGERKLLESLDLPVPDPMVLLTGPSLESPRVPSGIVPFEAGEWLGIPALILVRLYPDTIDRAIRKRLSCGLSDPSRLGEGSAGEAIAETFCNIYTMLNEEVWFFLSVRKAYGSSHEDFCRQVQALTEDAYIATVVRFSLEGTKGRYILLPPQCKTQQ